MNRKSKTPNIIDLLGSPAFGGAFYMVIAGLLFAIANVCIQAVTMKHGLAASSAAFWQYLIALLFAVPWVVRQGVRALATDQWLVHIGRVVLAVIGVQFWVLGLAHVPIWQAIALIMTSPFFVTVGAGLFLGEKIGASRWVAVILGFIGGMIILAPWSDAMTWQTIYPVAAAFFWAMSSLVTKRLTRTEKPDAITLYLILLLTPINGAFALFEGIQVPGASIALIVLASGLAVACAQAALTRAYAVADAAYVQTFDHIKLPFNVLLGWVFFGFLPVGTMWLGVALIVASSLYILRVEKNREHLKAVTAD